MPVGTPGRPYTHPPFFRGPNVGGARPPYSVSREPLRSIQDPRLRYGEAESGQLTCGGLPRTQSLLSRNPEDGVNLASISSRSRTATPVLRPLTGYV